MNGGLAAAQQGVIHTRNIVEHQRRGVHHLHGAGEIHQRGLTGVAAEIACGKNEQQRAHPLARRQRAFAHRGADQIALLARRQKLVKAGLQRVAQRLQFDFLP